MRITSLGKIFKTIFLVLLFGAFSFRFLSGIDFLPVESDELDFVARSGYFDLFFLERDFENKDWQAFPAYDQPPMAYYVYGLSLHLGGYQNLPQKTEELGFNKMILGWSSTQSADTFQMVNLGRKTAVVFALGSLILIYLLGNKLAGFWSEVLSVSILALNPLMFSAGRRATADSILLFFLLANALLIVYALKSFGQKKNLKFFSLSFLIGVNAGLAMGTKLNGIITLVVWGAAFFLILIGQAAGFLKEENRVLFLLLGVLISILTAFSFFVFLNPYLWQDPFSSSLRMLFRRMGVALAQQSIWPNQALISFPERIMAVLSQTLLPKGEWNNFGIPFLDLTLFLTGLGCLAAVAGQRVLRGGQVSAEAIIIIWVLFTFVSVASYIPMDWDRYYLPLVPCIVIVQVYAINRAGKFIWNRLIEPPLQYASVLK